MISFLWSHLDHNKWHLFFWLSGNDKNQVHILTFFLNNLFKPIVALKMEKAVWLLVQAFNAIVHYKTASFSLQELPWLLLNFSVMLRFSLFWLSLNFILHHFIFTSSITLLFGDIHFLMLEVCWISDTFAVFTLPDSFTIRCWNFSKEGAWTVTRDVRGKWQSLLPSDKSTERDSCFWHHISLWMFS